MNLLFLCKRHPQQRDLLTRPHGRFYWLPTELAARGHDVQVALLSHRRLSSEKHSNGGVSWFSDDLFRAGPGGYWKRLLGLTKSRRIDWVIGCSDLYYGILAARLARIIQARVAIDAYDNFESYMPFATPLHRAWRRALAHADLVTAAGPQLADFLSVAHARPVQILPMTADPAFAPAPRAECRRSLELPGSLELIGHCGSFTRTRGSRVVLDAFERVQARRPAARLVLSGRHPADLARRDGILSVGMVPDMSMPSLVGSLNVACVPSTETAFGRYSYPVKLCEAIACGVPIVASATGPARWMLHENPLYLARVGDADDMAQKIIAQLDAPQPRYPALPGWPKLARHYESLLAERAAKSATAS